MHIVNFIVHAEKKYKYSAFPRVFTTPKNPAMDASLVSHYDKENRDMPDTVRVITVSDTPSLCRLVPNVPGDVDISTIYERTFSYQLNEDRLVWIIVAPPSKGKDGLRDRAIQNRIAILLAQGPPSCHFSALAFPDATTVPVIPRLMAPPPVLEGDLDFQLFDIYYDHLKALIHLFGKTRDAYSVHAVVEDLRFSIRIGHQSNDRDHLEEIAEQLVETEAKKRTGCKYVLEEAWPLDQYRKFPVWTIKLTANRFSALRRLKNLAAEEHGCTSYHMSINPASHFCVNQNIQTHSVVRLTEYIPVRGTGKESYCDYEVRVSAKNVHRAPEEFQKNHPALLMGLDIETLFVRPPSSKLDPIINISVVGQQTSTPLADRSSGTPERWEWKYLFCLGDTPDVPGCTQVFSFANERQLLLGFFEFLHYSNVDGIVGHNVRNFDIKYIIERCQVLGGVTANFSKLINNMTTFELDWMENKAMGRMETVKIRDMCGTFIMDTLDMAKRGFGGKLKSLKLEFLAQTFLGQGKDDVKYEDIHPIFFSGPQGRCRLATYCQKDTELAVMLMNRWDKYNEAVEFCKLSSYLPINNVETTGVTTRLTNVLFWFVAHIIKKKILFLDKEASEKDGKYEGALVLEPVVGFHRYVTTLDFEGLYPSIMIEGNISPDMVIAKEFADHEKLPADDASFPLPPDNCPGGAPIRVRLDGDTVWVRPSLVKPGKLWFVERAHQEGVFALFLNWLKSERATYKALMKQHLSGTAEYFSLNNKQNAVKLMMNSLYGALGSALEASRSSTWPPK